jgi:hypothetical protein
MTNLIQNCFILQYVYYDPLHVSSIICSSSGGRIVLMQHLLSSLSVSGCPLHRLSQKESNCLSSWSLLKIRTSLFPTTIYNKMRNANCKVITHFLKIMSQKLLGGCEENHEKHRSRDPFCLQSPVRYSKCDTYWPATFSRKQSALVLEWRVKRTMVWFQQKAWWEHVAADVMLPTC